MALKNSFFAFENMTMSKIYNKALLCRGDEETLNDCDEYEGKAGKRCPDDHSEDAGVICNGMLSISPTMILTFSCMKLLLY